MTEVALLLLLPCHHTRTPLSQSGTTEWFHMKKQHLKPMVKVGSHLHRPDTIGSNFLALGWEARGGGKTRLRRGFSSFLT